MFRERDGIGTSGATDADTRCCLPHQRGAHPRPGNLEVFWALSPWPWAAIPSIPAHPSNARINSSFKLHGHRRRSGQDQAPARRLRPFTGAPGGVDPAPQRPEPEPARFARAAALRPHQPGRDRGPARSRAGASAGPRTGHAPVQRRTCADRAHACRSRSDGTSLIVINPGAFTHTSVALARCAGRGGRPLRRGAPVQRACPRGLPPPVIRVRTRAGRDLRLRAAGLRLAIARGLPAWRAAPATT